MIPKTLKQRIRHLLSLNDTPERLALAFSLGVFLTCTPFLGLHMLLAFAVAFFSGLNRVALLFGLFVNNPWTLVPYYTAATYVGAWLMGSPTGEIFPDFEWSNILDIRFWAELPGQWQLLLPMALGSTILAVFCAALSYPLALYAIRRGRAYLHHHPRPAVSQ